MSPRCYSATYLFVLHQIENVVETDNFADPLKHVDAKSVESIKPQ